MKNNFREIKVWRGEYREIPFEINNFQIGEKNQWTFYLIIRENQFTKATFDKFWLSPRHYESCKKIRTTYDYYDQPLINDIEWHCGCTYYRKLAGFDGEKRSVQIGCDYGHLYDETQKYSVEDVYYDTKQAIDSLYKLIPEIKHWCFYCGKWGIDEYVKRGDGYICIDCAEKHYPELLKQSKEKK